jgi:hypothetical protein
LFNSFNESSFYSTASFRIWGSSLILTLCWCCLIIFIRGCLLMRWFLIFLNY